MFIGHESDLETTGTKPLKSKSTLFTVGKVAAS